MSPRPRTVDDSTILEAAVTVLGRIGPEKLTLADVGEEAGLSAATLVQRFGSKRDLLLSVLRFATEGFDQRFETAISGSESPLEAIFAAAMERVPQGGPQELANMYAFYLSDLGDPDFRALAAENSRKAVAGFKRMLDEAVAAGELTESYIDTDQLASTIYSLMMGTLITWTITGEGAYKQKIRAELDVLLRPFRRGPRKASTVQREGADRTGTKFSASAPAAV
ncbi:MAG TPA: TetR/AcrR family transcriptional regulator [Gemmatimonadaceae bacterium]